MEGKGKTGLGAAARKRQGEETLSSRLCRRCASQAFPEVVRSAWDAAAPRNQGGGEIPHPEIGGRGNKIHSARRQGNAATGRAER